MKTFTESEGNLVLSVLPLQSSKYFPLINSIEKNSINSSHFLIVHIEIYAVETLFLGG